MFTAPRHPYTALLMASAPSRSSTTGRSRSTSSAGPPPTRRPPSAAGGCVFAARCPFAVDACAVQPPLEPVAEAGADRWSAACHRRDQWQALARERPAVAAPR